MLLKLIVSLLAVVAATLPTGSVLAQAESISISPTLGSPKTTSVTVTGANFTAGTYTITYDNTTVGTVDTSDGSWIQSFVVPASTLGTHTVKAGTSTATFTVESKTSLSSNRDSVGTRVTASGDGFAASQAGLLIVFDGEQVLTTAANSLGSFSASFSVPARSGGSYVVTIANGAPLSFTVISSVSIDESSGPPGTSVSITGSGFNPNVVVRVTFDGTQVTTVSSSNNGSVSTSFQVPVAPRGSRSINVSSSSTSAAQITFNVTPVLSLDRLNSSPGATVTASGVGFAANENPITVTIDQAAVATGISADTNGSWTASLLIPSLPAGPHTVRASGSLTSESSVPSLTLTLGADLTLERSSGPPGTGLEVTGSGFAPRESITVTIGDGLTEISVSADSQGAWTADVTIPPAPNGRLVIRASGATGQPKEANFTVTPTVSLSQPTGTPGSLVTIEGQGFTANQSGISISFESGVLASASANSQGSWTSTITIPPAPTGAHPIRVSGANPPLEVPFTVTPDISLSRTTGEPGAPVTVTGSGFGANERGITVTLDQTPVAEGISANAEGSWSVSFTLPSLPTGSYSVQVAGSRTSTTSIPEVTLTVGADLSLDRSSGPPGTTFKVSGAGFRARESITVTIGEGLAETIVAANDLGTWTANVSIPPAPGGRLLIRAFSAGGQQMDADFIVTAAVSLSQPTASPGTLLTIEGRGFGANQSGISISFGSDVVASATANSQGSWTSTLAIPASPAGSYNIGVSSLTGELRVPFLTTPVFFLSRTQAEHGATINLSGSGFAANEKGITVTLGQTPVASGISADGDGSWTASFLVPSLPGTAYTVQASGPLTSGNTVPDEILSIGPGLVVTPANTSPGSAVNVTGHGFKAKQRDITITYDGVPVATVLIADAQGSFNISLIVPLSASGLHSISHSVAGSEAIGGSDATFQVVPSISLNQSDGPPGTAITISGLGFAANDTAITIAYNDNAVRSGVAADAQGSFTASILVPPSPAGTHTIQASGPGLASISSPPRDFTITTSLALSRSSGNVGDGVEVVGLGFAPTTPVTLSFGDVVVEAGVTTDDSGSIHLEFTIPASTHGEHVIMMADESGHEAKATLSVESTSPAAPQLLGPEDGARGGFFGGFRPSPTWSSVDDPSGVSYVLQIATDPNFSDPILEKRGLELLFYSLTEQEALPRGKYHWRVRAIDGASNESVWSNTFEVKSGIVPIWIIPVLVALGVVLAGGAGYTFVSYRRRRWRQQLAFPELVREVGAEPALPAPGRRLAPVLRPTTRLALPAPSRRRRGRSPEEQARLQLVLDFMRSIPLIQVSFDLAWLDELLETTGSATPDAYEQVLQGQIELGYQPGWLRHPTYEEVQRILEGHAFLERLDEFVGTVNESAVDMVSLLRQVYGDVAAALPPEIPRVYQWRFVLAVVQHSLAWFRGTYLREPSARDYILIPVSDSEDESFVSLHGEETTPFPGPLIEGIIENDAIIYRDIHIQLRMSYMDSEEARSLAARIATIEVLREQLITNLEELDQTP